LFPFGEDKYQEHIELSQETDDGVEMKRVRVSVREFVAFRIQEMSFEDSVVLRSRRLFSS